MPVNPDHILSQEPSSKPYLLAPLGWLYDDLEPLWHAHPEIIQVLLSLGHPQIHGLALVACTAQTSLTVPMLRVLAGGPEDRQAGLIALNANVSASPGLGGAFIWTRR
jgi:hypothetical protein